MKKRIFFLFIFIMSTIVLNAQQESQYSQNTYTQLLTNPGYAGSDGRICAFALSRTQWSGFEGAPSVITFNVDGSVKKFGIGVSIENDTYGFEKNLKANLSLAYKFSLGNGNLGVGLKWGIANSTIDADWNAKDDYNLDPAIPIDGSNNTNFLDFGFGLYYKAEGLYLGISSTHLLESELEYINGEGGATAVPIKRHYYITAGYNMPFANPLLEFKPSILVQSDGVKTQLGFTGLFEYNKKLWGGVSLRTDKAIIGILGAELFKWVKVSYSYDFVVSDMMDYNNGTHEIVMGFCIDVKKDKTPEKYKSIRFL